MEIKLKISGFKCFSEDEFLLRDVTVLTGSNGAGKSSLIQALLLTRLAIEKNLKQLQKQSEEIVLVLKMALNQLVHLYSWDLLVLVKHI